MEILKSNLISKTAAAVGKQVEDKGSIGNRLEYAVKQGFGLRATMVKDSFATTAGIAASVGAAAAVAKSKTAQNILTKGFQAAKNSSAGQKVVTALKDIAATAAPYAKKALGWFKALPAPAKAVLAAGVVLTGIVSNNIRTKGIYNAGKLDQEYTDKAKLQKQLS